MPSLIRFFLAGLFCVVTALGAVNWLASFDPGTGRPDRARHAVATTRAPGSGSATSPGAGTRRESGPISVDESRPFERGGFDIALRFTGPVRDPRSLGELRESIRGRGRRGLDALGAELDQLPLDPRSD